MRWKLVQGCMYVQSAIPKMYDNVSDIIFHREYFTTVCLSQRCRVGKKKQKPQVLLQFVTEL